VGRRGVRRTAYADGRAYVHFYGRFFRHLVSPQHFDGAVDCADEGVAIVCVGRGAVGAVEVGESDFWDGHCVYA
jgi:hypothetical protein